MGTSRRALGKSASAAKGESQAEVCPFDDGLGYLEAWFRLLGRNRESDESPAALGDVPSFDERTGYLRYLTACTKATVEAGVSLPVEDFVVRHQLDIVDRLILLALLRAALDPVGDGGVRLVYLLRALGADSLARRAAASSRLEVSGGLRDCGAIQCFPHANISDRLYRLAPWLVTPLTTGEGDGDGLPVYCPDPLAAVDRVRSEVFNLWEVVKAEAGRPIKIWSVPAEGGGWDLTGLRRMRVAARLESLARVDGDPIGTELRRLKLDPEERLCWAMLFVDGLESPVGIPVPRLLRYCGQTNDPVATAERLLGAASKLGLNDCVRFNRADAPLLRRIVWISRDTQVRVVPWHREDFEVKAGTNGEPPAPQSPRVMGFDAKGTEAEGSAARATEAV